MLYTYDQFLLEKELVKSQRQLMVNIFEQFAELKPIMETATMMVEEGFFDMPLMTINEESLLQKAKAKFDQAVQVAKEKGKQALSDAQEKIIKLGGNIANVVKLIIEKLKQWIAELWEGAKAWYTKVANGKAAELKKKIEGEGPEYKTKLANELKNAKTMASGVSSWISSGFVKDTAKAAMTAAKQDESIIFDLAIMNSINEAVISGQIDFTDLLNEGEGGIPYLSAIAHKMHEIPPFNLLDKVKKAAEKIAGGTLNTISYYATELAGAPGPYKFVTLATLIAILAEVKFKFAAEHAIVHAIPGLGTIAHIISYTALVLAGIAVIEALIKKEEGAKPKEGDAKA